MNAYQVKDFLHKNGLKVADMAREIAEETGRTEKGVRTSLDNLFFREVWNKKLADIVAQKYGLIITRPHQYQSISQLVKQAA